MTYFECDGCGNFADFARFDVRQLHAECPVCDERTRWTIAFDDPDAGVTF